MTNAEKPRGSWLSILLVAVGSMIALAVLIVLTLGQMILVVLIVGGLFALAAFHYLVWGWWLSGMIRDEDESDSLPPKTPSPDRGGDSGDRLR